MISVYLLLDPPKKALPINIFLFSNVQKITSAENLQSRALDDLAIELNINCNRKLRKLFFKHYLFIFFEIIQYIFENRFVLLSFRLLSFSIFIYCQNSQVRMQVMILNKAISKFRIRKLSYFRSVFCLIYLRINIFFSTI